MWGEFRKFKSNLGGGEVEVYVNPDLVKRVWAHPVDSGMAIIESLGDDGGIEVLEDPGTATRKLQMSARPSHAIAIEKL